jgi:hypothetical protein
MPSLYEFVDACLLPAMEQLTRGRDRTEKIDMTLSNPVVEWNSLEELVRAINDKPVQVFHSQRTDDIDILYCLVNQRILELRAKSASSVEIRILSIPGELRRMKDFVETLAKETGQGTHDVDVFQLFQRPMDELIWLFYAFGLHIQQDTEYYKSGNGDKAFIFYKINQPVPNWRIQVLKDKPWSDRKQWVWWEPVQSEFHQSSPIPAQGMRAAQSRGQHGMWKVWIV